MKPYQPTSTNSGYVDKNGNITWEQWECRLCGQSGNGKLPEKHVAEARAHAKRAAGTAVQ